eukprot:1737599-Rhodomonas_salina.1
MDDETKLHLWVVVEEHIYLEIGEHLAKFFALEAKDQDEKLKSAYENFAHVTPEEMMNGCAAKSNAFNRRLRTKRTTAAAYRI